MHGEELFDRDDGFDETVSQPPQVLTIHAQKLEPHIREAVEKILRERNSKLSHEITIGMKLDRDVCAVYVSEQMRMHGIPVIEGFWDSVSGWFEFKVANPLGYG